MDPAEEVLRAARAAAAALRPALLQRLLAVYGADWLARVNERRRREGRERPGRGLDDHRFCLAVFAHDPATADWAREEWRRGARQLGSLSNRAAHDEPLTPADVHRARSIARAARGWRVAAHPAPDGATGSAHGPPPARGKDVTTELRVSARDASYGGVIEVRVTRRTGDRRSFTVKVRLPVEVRDGQLLRMPGRGAPGSGGGPPGDLYLRVRVGG
ncbi:DnaJ C-terminal domain-containing protein [Streptomyces sp. NPDC059785]|uniref:DnaJ C-terminal domain-containing protein n=1 Tax=unclassified Streptomyces TaxID=2593676 RepID=UPI0036488C2C